MTRFTMIAVLAVALAAGCKKKEENAASGTAAPVNKEGTTATEPTPTPTPAPTEGTAPAAGATAEPAKAEYKPDEIWKATAGQDRMALMEKFKDGATVTGTVKTVKDDPTGEYVLVFDAGDGKSIEAMIADPAKAKEKKLKAGDTVTVTKCQVANPTDASLPLRTCELK